MSVSQASAEITMTVEDAPEIKGTSMYIKPDRCVWTVVAYVDGPGTKPRFYYHVRLIGPSTRTARPNEGSAYFDLGDCPGWVPRPNDDWLDDSEATIDRCLSATTYGERR